MAKKNQRQQNPSKPKEFHVTPFGALKGVVNLLGQAALERVQTPQPPQVAGGGLGPRR